MLKKLLSISLVFIFLISFSKDVSFEKGVQLFELEAYQQAKKMFQQAVQNENSRLKILECNFMLQNFDTFEQELTAFRKSIRDSSLIEQADLLQLQYLLNTNNLEKAHFFAEQYTPKTIFNKGSKAFLLGTIYLRKNQFELAKSNFTNAINLLSKFKESKYIRKCGMATNGIAVVYYYQSEIEKAMQYYLKAKELFQKFPQHNATEIARVNYNLSLIYFEQNRTEEAIHLVKNALEINKKKFGENHKRVAECYSVLGSIYLEKGELDKALDYFTRDKEICEAIYGKEHIEAAYAYFDCGMVYSELKDYYHAQYYLEKALAIRQKFLEENNEDISENYLELAIIYIALQKYDEARLLCKKVISNEQQLGTENSMRMAESYYRIGLIDKVQFKYNEAIKNFNIAIEIYNTSLGIKNNYNLGIYLNIAEIKLDEKKYNEALLFTKKALPDNKNDLFPVTLAYLQYLKIIQQRDLNKSFAIEQNKKYLEILIGLTNKIQDRKFEYIGEKSKLSDAEILAQISAIAIPLTEQLYQLENKKEYLEWMYFFIENNKANALNSNLKNKNNNSSIIKKIEQINAEIEQQSLNETNDSKIKQLKNELFILKKQYELETKKVNNSNIKEDKNTIPTIQQKLNPKTAFLDYYNQGQSTYLLAITNNNSTLYKIDLSEESIKILNNSIQAKKYDKELAKKITRQLIPTKILDENIKLIIAPDGMTRNISFGALIHQNKYLIEQYNISHTFSGRIYFGNDNKKQLTNDKVLCIAPNYKQSNYTPLQNIDEIKLIQPLLQSKILVAKDANIDNYNLNKDNFGIIHFSAHSQIDSLIPTSSAIIFQPDSLHNYFLKISTIIQQNINTNLVSLNMCQGGFGRKNSGEGILNFAWAFQYAGAKNILVTRWNASDKVAKTMMTYFYKNIKNKQSYEDAIRNAKLAYLMNTDAMGAEPFFWSNYSIYSTFSKENHCVKYIIFTLTLLFLGILLFYFKNISKKNNVSTS